MKRLSLVSMVLGTLCIISFSGLAADFAPTLLKLSAPPIVQYNFSEQSLEIPVQVSGTPAGIIFCIFTRGKSNKIANIRNGHLGWHYVNKVDTCIYFSPMKHVGIGQTTITWNGKDQDGGVVPPDEFTYYIWAFDNQGVKQQMSRYMPSGWSFDFSTEIQGVDEDGLPLANPIWYNPHQRWIIGGDPFDETLKITTNITLADGWRRRGDSRLDPKDFNYQYISVGNSASKLGSLHKIKFVPGGDAEIQTGWGGDGGYATMFDTNGGDSPGVALDGAYLYTGDENHVTSIEPDSQFYIYDMDGYLIQEIDLTPWWSSADDFAKGGQMNGGPINFAERDGYVFLNCHCNCLNQMVDPKRYLDTCEYEDFFVWSNGNGDYTLDHNFEETAWLPWVCNDYNVGPYKYSICPDKHYFTAVNAYDVGAVSFGLFAPDGTGLGYYAFAGETAGWKKGTLFLQSGTPFDGLYCDNEQTQGPHYDRCMAKLEPGIFFLGHDSISGIITTNAGPYLLLTTPRGGEFFERVSTCRISWTAYLIEHLKIEYSTNRGSTWTTIADRAAASAGFLDWRVPSIVSDHCFIRITDASNADRTDENDTAFSIVFPENVREYYVVDVENTGANASIIIQANQVPRINGEPIDAGDCIGVFTPRGICAGALMWSGVNSVITVWGDDPLVDGIRGFVAGDHMTFKIWDSSEKKECVVNAAFSLGSNIFTADGFYVIDSLENQSIRFDYPLTSGWNLISLPLTLNTWYIDSVLSSIQTSVVMVKNGAGNVYWPAYQINTIGEWNKLHGYQVYVDASCTLTLTGYELFVPDLEYRLNRGWNLISYPGTNGASPEAVFDSILDTVVIVKNNDGNVFWPEYGIDDIASMYQGQGYWINLASPVTFRYQAVSAKPLAASANDSRETVHFRPAGNTGSNATVLLTSDSFTAYGIMVNYGDEIGIFTQAGICVGAALYCPGKNMAVPVWGDDNMTDEIEGLVQGEALRIIVWNMDSGRENDISSQFESSTAAYEHNALIMPGWLSSGGNNATAPSIEPLTFSLSQNSPNPFNPATTVSFTLPAAEHATVEVFNISGQRVAVLADGIFSAGRHNLVWNAADNSAGVYFCRVRAGANMRTVKMALVK